MRALNVTAPWGLDAIQVADVPDPVAGPGQVLVLGPGQGRRQLPVGPLLAPGFQRGDAARSQGNRQRLGPTSRGSDGC